MNKKKKRKQKAHEYLPGMKKMRCPYCRSPLTYRSADGIYRNNPNDAHLWVCSRYPECDSYVRAHPGTDIPVGSLANRELRTLRKTAHDYFNQLYMTGIMSKNDAYIWLACMLNVPLSQAHIGYLGEHYCNQVINESKRMLASRGYIVRQQGSYQPLQIAVGGEQFAYAGVHDQRAT